MKPPYMEGLICIIQEQLDMFALFDIFASIAKEISNLRSKGNYTGGKPRNYHDIV